MNINPYSDSERGQAIMAAVDTWREFAKKLSKRNSGRVQRGQSLLKFDPYKGRGRIIALLSSDEGVVQSALAEEVGITPQTLSTALKKLDEEGIVRREPDSMDKRATKVFLTPDGAKIKKALVAQEGIAGSVFEALDGDELKTFVALNRKLIERLDQELEIAQPIASIDSIDPEEEQKRIELLAQDIPSFPDIDGHR